VAELKIDIDIDKEGLSGDEISYTTNAISDIAYNLEINGYNTEVADLDDSFSLSFTKHRQCPNQEKALDTLLGFMSDDTSPFSYIEGGYSESFFNDIYNINTTLDLSNIISSDFMDTLTASHRKKIEDALSSFTGTVKFDLYGDTVEYTGALIDSVNSEELSLSTPISISRSVSIDHPENIEEHNALTQRLDEISLQKERYKTLLIIIGAIAALLIILLAISLIKRKINKRYYY
jgi:hypothetical protein